MTLRTAGRKPPAPSMPWCPPAAGGLSARRCPREP